jgi:DNA-binding Lrp family transcriptional regulator
MRFVPRICLLKAKVKVVTIHNQLTTWLHGLTTVSQIDLYQTFLWRGLAEGQLNDAQAIELTEAAAAKRETFMRAREQRRPPAGTYFPRRELTGQSRNKAASGVRCSVRWARKRRLGDMAALPPHLRDLFTEGERAVLYVIASDCRQHGSCQCSVKEIGDRAGVGATTVRNALRRAKDQGIIGITERPQWRAKHLTNVISIICERWLSWLKKFRPNLGLKFEQIGFKIPKATETYGYKSYSRQPKCNRLAGPTGGILPFAGRKPASG